MAFQKATKKKAKLRLTFDGTAGAGKTYSALVLAKELGGRTALIDTEHGSASKYADLFDFDQDSLEEFSLDTYLRAIKTARDAGYDNLIIDSLTHAWTGKGGALEEVDRSGGNSKFTGGWRTVTPKHTALIDAILAYPGHVICTMRKKMEYVLETVVKNGKETQVPKKVGMAPVQREGMEYEFDVVADLDTDGSLTIAKTRCSALEARKNQLRREDVVDIGRILKAWLTDGAEVPVVVTTFDKPAAATAPAGPNPASGTVPSEREKQEILLAEITVHADLKKWAANVEDLLKAGKLTRADKDGMRGLFNAQLGKLSAAGRAA